MRTGFFSVLDRALVTVPKTDLLLTFLTEREKNDFAGWLNAYGLDHYREYLTACNSFRRFAEKE